MSGLKKFQHGIYSVSVYLAIDGTLDIGITWTNHQGFAKGTMFAWPLEKWEVFAKGGDIKDNFMDNKDIINVTVLRCIYHEARELIEK